MPAATFARRALVALAPLTVALLAIAGCTGGDVGSDGSTPVAPSEPPVVVVTDAPTTTQAPTAATPLVRQAVLDYWTAQQRCQQRPSNCRPERFTADQGTLRSDVAAAVSTMLASGWHRGTPDEADGGYVAVGAITVGPDATTATADECVYDPSPLLDSKDVVVTSVAVPHHITHTVYLEGDTWKVGDEVVDPTGSCDITIDSIPSDLTIPTT